MQFNFIIFGLATFIGFLRTSTLDVLVSQSKDIGLKLCEDVYDILTYTRTTEKITVIDTTPLRVRVHLLAEGPTKSTLFTVEGMVCDAGFDQNAANAACRSQNASKAIYFSNLEWHEASARRDVPCIIDTGDYKGTIPCEYILHNIDCPSSATSLHLCRYPDFFSKSSSCNRSTHVGLLCI